MSKKIALLFVALTLGLGWAIRGHFGHEWGASWAGAMASLAVVVAAKREDWSLRLPVLVMLGGIGWAVGGIMSYGIVVGYGRGIHFGNVYYGLAMLGVIGGLYGYIGGGLLGLGLESTDEKKPDWPTLLTQMIVGALFFWYVLIPQFEWKMTPPRSELWAACFGASIAMAWFLYRNGFHRALRLAAYSALGGGFGFAFGNFLQTIGTTINWPFNWWNVMEFTLGFFGGLGMAYGIITREWPVSVKPSQKGNWLAFLFILFIIPATNLIHVFDYSGFVEMGKRMNVTDPGHFATTQILSGWFVLVIVLIPGILIWRRAQNNVEGLVKIYGPIFLFGYSTFYIILSHIKKGIFIKGVSFQLEQYLYWAVLLVVFLIWLFSGRKETDSLFTTGVRESWRLWITIILVVLIVIAVLTFISIHVHSGLGGYHERF